MGTVKMQMNVPVTVERAKYLDVVPGQYGAQLRVKGAIDGDPDGMLYLPGKLWAARNALADAGVITADAAQAMPEEPEKATAVPLAKQAFTLVLKQVPGKTYGNVEVTNGNGNGHANGATRPHHAPTPPPPERSTPDAAPAAPSAGEALLAMLATYQDTLGYVLSSVAPKLRDAGVTVSAESVMQSTHALFIERNRRGL